MDANVTYLGSVSIEGKHSVRRTAEKLYTITQLLNFPEVESARTSLSISNALRQYLPLESAVTVKCNLVGNTRANRLNLVFPWLEGAFEELKKVNYFDSVSNLSPGKSSGENSISIHKNIVFASTVLSDSLIEQLRAIISQKTAEELMLELQEKNLELNAHQENLETRIEHRTKQLKHALDKANVATKAKDNFLAAMSHEIRTPMNGIIGMVDILLQSKMDADHKKMLKTIHDSSQSLLVIINDILDFSKIEADKLDLEDIEINLLEIVEGCAQTLATAAQSKGLRLLCFVDPELQEVLIGDPVRIRQIVLNLTGNAIKFTSEGEVRIQVDKIGGEGNRVKIKISVIDDGIGIKQSALKELFQPFSQADSSTTRQFGGTGLGLTISKRLTEMMGGKISASSEPGKGSVFSVTLGLPVKDIKSEKIHTNDLNNIRVLLVSKSEAEIDYYTRYLQYWGAGVTSCNDPDEAMNICTEASKTKNDIDILVIGPFVPLEEQLAFTEKVLEKGLTDIHFIHLSPENGQGLRLEKNNSIFIGSDPTIRANLISAVAVSAGRESPEVYLEADIDDMKSEGPLLSVEEAREKGSLILVAEDNPTNRDVIGRQLALLGYTCEIMEDGMQAYNAWRSGNYGLLLTDCHMPNMDGYELARQIRQDEQKLGKHIPIIAITANAQKGEIERCRDAGMDDYLSKPFKMEDFKSKLAEWLPVLDEEDELSKDRQKQTGRTRQSNKTSGTKVKAKRKKKIEKEKKAERKGRKDKSAIDLSTLQDIFGDDTDTINTILVEFLPVADEIIQDIVTGMEQDSLDLVREASHKLKSAARGVGASKLATICEKIEDNANEEKSELVSKQGQALLTEFQGVKQYIEKL